jgi:hypothetical protein
MHTAFGPAVLTAGILTYSLKCSPGRKSMPVRLTSSPYLIGLEARVLLSLSCQCA